MTAGKNEPGWKKVRGYNIKGRFMKLYRPKNKKEVKEEQQDTALWLFFLLIITFLAIGLPFIIFWLQ